MNDPRRTLPFTLLALVAAGGLMGWRLLSAEDASADVQRQDAAPEAPLALATPLDAAGERQAAAKAEPAAEEPEPDLAARSFDEIYADLVQVFLTSQVRGSSGQPFDPAGTNAQASALFKEIAEAGHAAGQGALTKLDAVPSPWSGERALAEALTCQLLLDFELQQMSRAAIRAEQMSALVSSLIERLPFSAKYAALVQTLLEGQPYMGPEHEGPLMDLAPTAYGDLSYMAEPIRVLLVTLWEQLGGDRETDVETLLRYLNDPSGGVLGLAAQQALLKDPKYRDLVVACLIQAGDEAAMNDMATFAAKELEVEGAIAVTKALRGAAQYTHFGGAYAALSERAPSELLESYGESLAANLDPKHREQAIQSLAWNIEDPALKSEVAAKAFRDDPEPRVRGVALLALGVNAKPEVFRESFDLAMKDPDLRRSYLVGALSNHASRNDPEAVTGMVEALLKDPSLNDKDRKSLEALR